ncbi:MAG: hypothetical protein SOX32_04495, partial [Candidatus Choladocola sp.]|nr:hypothetical protein [Candidatus Choladocola sp.]
GGSTGSTGGSAGSTGGSTGSTGGSTGNTGGSIGSTGGSTGSTVGSAGSTGGSTGSTGNTGVGQEKFVLPKTTVRNGYKITIANTVLEYSGKSLKPAVTVKYGGRKIKEKYYTVKYSSNKKTGLAAAVIRGKGAYAKKIPETKLHFVIVPRRMTITSVKNSKNGTAAVGWKTDGLAGGYQLQICRNSKFKEGVTSYEIKKTKKGRTITGLKKKKTYYFRIRPYIKVKNTLFYGRWSKVRSIKIKK